MRLVLLGGAPGVGKSAVARAVLVHHAGPVGSAPLLQWVDVDALWLHQPWRVDDATRALVAENLAAVLGGAARAGVDVVLVTWTFHAEELRDVVRRAAPPGTPSTTVQLVVGEAAWRERFAADSTRGTLDGLYEERYASAQALPADLVVDTTHRTVGQCADDVSRLTLVQDSAELWRRVATAQHGPGYAEAYAERFRALAADGEDVHGEARCVQRLLPAPARVLDAGCGTGRVAARLADLGYEVLGTDADAAMLEVARREHPHLPWLVADLADLTPAQAGGRFDAVLLAGNVVPFLAGALPAAARRCAQLLAPGGLLVAGFGLDDEHLPEGCEAVPLAVVLGAFEAAGLAPERQWTSWDGAPPAQDGGYAVLVLRAAA